MGSVPKGYYGERNWTEEQLDDLEEMLMQGLSDKTMARQLGRSVNAVQLKRKRIGVKPRLRQFNSARRIAGRMGVDVHAVTRWIKLGYLAAKQGQKWGLNRQWYVSEEALYNFLLDRNCHHVWNAGKITDPSLKALARSLHKARYLTPGEVAARFSVVVGAVNDWINRGSLKAYRWGNWWIKEEDLAGFVIPSERPKRGMLMKRFTREEDARLLALRAEGLTWQEIGEAMGRTLSSVAGRWERLLARRSRRAA